MKTYWIEIYNKDTRQVYVGNWNAQNVKEAKEKAVAYYAHEFFMPMSAFKVLKVTKA